MSDKFCILPFIHMEIQPSGDVFSCCHSNEPTAMGNLHKDELTSLWSSKNLKDFQEQFLSEGEKLPSHCDDCVYYESLDAKSWRQSENENWKLLVEEIKETKTALSKPRSMSVRFSNLCNYACRTCKPATSTAWFKDAKFLNPTGEYFKKDSAPKDNPIIKQMAPFIDGLTHLYFAGGEPLLEKEHYDILKKVINENPKVELSYDTNLSVLGLGKENAIELWNQFKVVNLSASADGFGPQGDFIRKGMKWNEFVDNWNTVKREAPHVRMMMNFTLSIYNMFHVLDFVREVKRLGLFDDNDERDLTISLVEEPEWQSLQTLPKHVKEIVEKRYRDFMKEFPFGKVSEDLDNAIKYMNGADKSDQLKKFQVFNTKVDFLRSESFLKLFPEEAQLLGLTDSEKSA